MHTNPAFRKTSKEAAITAASDRGFGTLILAGPDGPLASHIPFVIENGVVAAHLTRSNPILRQLRADEGTALITVTGPDAYISPDWYGQPDQVPTWNYVAIHLRGLLRERPATTLLGHLEALSAKFEARLEPKRPWTHHKMSEGVLERMMRMIVPVEMTIDDVQSTYKLGQNKERAARSSAVAHLETSVIGQDIEVLRSLMQATVDDDAT